MWWVLLLIVLLVLGWAFIRLARWSRETSEDLRSMEPSEDEKYGVWGIFRKRR